MVNNSLHSLTLGYNFCMLERWLESPKLQDFPLANGPICPSSSLPPRPWLISHSLSTGCPLPAIKFIQGDELKILSVVLSLGPAFCYEAAEWCQARQLRSLSITSHLNNKRCGEISLNFFQICEPPVNYKGKNK